MPEGGREKVDNPTGRLRTSYTIGGQAWFYSDLRDGALASTREKDMMWQAKR
jgi:hypothetical protein